VKSLLFQDGAPFVEPDICTPCRKEAEVVIRGRSRVYRVKVRDKIVVDDWYLVAVKAAAFAIQNAEPNTVVTLPRKARDFLIKENLVI